MPSTALFLWEHVRTLALNEFDEVHRRIGKKGRGIQHARQQIHQAHVLMLSGQFQGFCRDLHSECVDHLVNSIQPASVKSMLTNEFQFGRKLDTGNPNVGNIGNDFNRFELKFWDAVESFDPRIAIHKDGLKSMNEWRNAIAHQSIDTATLGGSTQLRYEQVKSWRRSCDSLANSFDEVMARHLAAITGVRPW
jgi:hypothetical protein